MRSTTVFPATTSSSGEEGSSPLVAPAMEEITEEGRTPGKDGAALMVARTERWLSSSPGTTVLRTSGVRSVMVGFVLLALLLGARRWTGLDAPSLIGNTVSIGARQRRRHHIDSTSPLLQIPFTCGNETSPHPHPPKCPGTPALPPPSTPPPLPGDDPAPSCPDYFRYIHDDLRPWRGAGITREAVERARPHAYFRLVVVGGRAYVETYRRAYQTRDVFTQWGVLQLLRRYPGRVPDLDIMFACDDPGQVRAADFPTTPSDAPPVFRYCKDALTLDIVFPDWSFWGWPEVGIRPWPQLLEEVRQENERVRWPVRQPYAFWKGNPEGYRIRHELMRCNASNGQEWNARLFTQNWHYAIQNGFKDSRIPKQCIYRYKVYVEGNAWSVSEKYILACDSPVLFVNTPFQDILSRGLVAGKHYWPINREHICKSIKFAVDWGNEHPAQAQLIGEQGSQFVREEMSMDYIYDYMLHLLTEYAKLLRYKPTVPEKAVEICTESMACPAQGMHRDCMMDSMERQVASFNPCTLPPPFTPEEAKEIADREAEVLRKVEKMEG
ncbi:protein O-glucosyltransferase 1 [Sorghum bicolor]|uniref:Glycosyl transferase CAP10 domain-containing protein n=1 Tax=Sorghum bicolor TaxID=4558 RepID=C5Z4C1_SORBI|nr:protein O-glucosyltransferase 1 [Sorghum bicolor]EER87863.2 hypothetical protein SORBI_3010G042300 [Sorghum bicolor]|eukprot:XP_002437850.1 protein O-glucosyltransferase 1 [Sorghum bicolor]